MKKLLLLLLIFSHYLCKSQGNMITINSTVPSQMTICGSSKTFGIVIYNPSPFTLTSDTLKITMPPGIMYQAGSIVGATESNTSTPNAPVFLLQDIPTLTTVNISYTASVGCDVMSYAASGGVIENKIRVNYTSNNIPNFDAHTTNSYIVRQPNLSIVSISNQSYTGSIGETFTRCINITNGGLGELSKFTLTDVHGSGIQITAVDKGTWSTVGVTETIQLNSNNFTTIGDNDTLFENGETITICETVNIINCISVASAFEAYWGCNNQNCQSSIANANVVFPNLIPNIIVTPNSGNIYAPMNSCLAQASQQELKVENTGLGQAVNVHLDVFQSTGSGYQNYLGSYIDENSFTIQIGSGAPIPISIDTAEVTAALSCMAPTAKGKVKLTIPTVNAGETVYIRWNTYSCCYNACAGTGQNYFNGWRYSGNYSNICQSDYIIPETWGRVYSQLYGSLDNNSSVSTLTSGQTGNFNFIFSSFGIHYSYPVSASAYWKLVFTLPNCLEYSGNMKITGYNGTDTWLPTSVTPSGNTLTAIFNGSAPFWLDHAEITLDLTLNCSGCSGASGGVELKAFYVPDASCACEVNVSCQTAAVSLLCPSPCPEGMAFSYFDIVRTSYGKPDNEAGGGDGLPDVGGTLDFSKIKTSRAMFGDTVTGSYRGTVITSLAHPSWQYCYASASISNGNLLSFLDAKLLIYRGGSLLATCTSFNPFVNTSGTTRTFLYDLSAPALIPTGCLPSGFVYSNNDSVVFLARYKVTVNTGGPIQNCYSTNEYYVADIPNPTQATDKYQCSAYNGNFSVVGYYFTNYGSDNFAVKSCDNVTIYQNYYLSIGPCCSNYYGGNLFPFEYRNWAHIDTLTAVVPPGYDFVSANIIEYRTKGTLNYEASSAVAVTPVNPNSETLVFPVEQYFQGYGGTIPLSDDGFAGTLNVVVTPSCEVTPTISQGIRHDWTFAPSSYLDAPGSYPTFISTIQDYITYAAPDLFLQSSLPSVLTPDNTTSWNISISNTSNVSDALNTWLSGPAVSGITIIQLEDVENNVVITPTAGGIYQVGTVVAGTIRNFKITATFTSCLQDSIVVYSGWNCQSGYPTNLTNYPCTPEQITLKSTPLTPLLVVNVTGPSSTVNLCDTASYTVQGVNVQLGTAYNVKLTATLPLGVNIVPGTSQLNYPISSPYVTISDPVSLGGTLWQWNISSSDSLIGADGLKGILQSTLNSFNITFKVITNCGYTSGSVIGFNLQGFSACGLPTGQDVALSSQLGISGATPPYTTQTSLTTTYISPCANNSTMKVVINNQGPSTTGTVDSVILQLPPGVSFVAGSLTSIYNSPTNGVPLTYTLNGNTYLVWALPSGIAMGDSSVFSFDYKGNPEVLQCDISEFGAQTISSTNVTCSVTGLSCPININTGDTTLAVYTYKAYLALSNASATSVFNPPTGETVSISMDIINTGQAITSGANSIVQFYYDANTNGVYDTSDVYITQDSITVSNNSTMQYTHTFDVPAGQACAIIAIIDTAVNPCACNPSQLVVIPKMINNFADTGACSAQTVQFGSLPVTGYTYSWSPAINLNDSTLSNPTFSGINSTNMPVSTDYVLTTNRMGCIGKDTITITIGLIPISNAGNDINACATTISQTIGTSSTVGYSYSWSPATGLSDSTISNPSVSLISTTNISYTVTTAVQGCTSKDTISVSVSPLPAATITGDTTVCVNDVTPTITFSVSNGTPPITIEYTINGGAVQTITSTTGNDVMISAPTTTSGTFVYNLVSVEESSVATCSQSLNESATIIVKPLPTASIAGSTQVCQNQTAPTITFTGASGTAPYTFTYSVNAGAPQTITTSVGNSITLDVPTTVSDTFNYVLISVSDSGAVSCSQLQADTATVIVNPSPIANFGLEEVCLNQSISFIDSTTVATNTISAWQWNFGDNSAFNTSQNPSYTYATDGTYTVTLIATSTNGCSDTVSKSAIVHPLPNAGFATNPSSTNLCGATDIQFTDTTTINAPAQITSWLWDFGDGIATGTSPNTTHAYDTGSYTVQLKVISDFGCADSANKTITIHPLPEANFGLEEVCLNQSIYFTDSSSVIGSNINLYEWTFGDNSAVNTLNNPNYSYITSGTYTVRLIVTTADGCKDTVSKTAIVHAIPNADFLSSPSLDGVCDDSLLVFNDASTINNTDTIQAWIWSFGDGSASVFETNTSHTYTTAGTYSVQLNVVSTFGCADTVIKTIIVNPNPVVSFEGNILTGCTPVCVNFVDSSTFANQWLWTVGGGVVSSSQNFNYCFNNDTSFAPVFYSVGLTVTSANGCTTTLTKTDYIAVNPTPQANFTTEPEITTVINPVYSFIDLSVGADSYLWDFGNDSTSTLPNPLAQEYDSEIASYTVELITSNQYGCVDTMYKTVFIEGDYSFYIPNAFSPNDDDVNDNFFGTGVGITAYELWVFDRWGNMLYYGDKIPVENSKWNGTVNGGTEQAQIDVYVWKVNLKDLYGKPHKYTGTVTLIR